MTEDETAIATAIRNALRQIDPDGISRLGPASISARIVISADIAMPGGSPRQGVYSLRTGDMERDAATIASAPPDWLVRERLIPRPLNQERGPA